MKRLLAAVTAPVLALALTVSASPAQAAAVKDKDLLSVAQVSAAYPDLASAERSVTATKKIAYNTTCKKTKRVATKSGKTAAYVPTGTSAASAPVVTTTVAEFKSVKVAKAAIQGQRVLLKCKKATQGGYTVKLKSLKAPKLGQDRVGVTGSAEIEGIKVVIDSYTFRQKARVISVSVSYVNVDPQRANGTKLAKKVYSVGK